VAPVNMRDPASGNVYVVEEDEVQSRIGEGWKAEVAEDQVQRLTDENVAEEYGGVSGAIAAGGAGVLRGATMGASDAVFAGLGEAKDFRNLREQHAGLSMGTEILGAVGAAALSGGSSLAAATPAGLAARAGASVARAGEGASLLARGGRLAAGGAIEGGADAVGQIVTQGSLYGDLDIEEMGSQILTSTVLGAGTNLAGAAASKALRKAQGKLDDVVARGAKAADGTIADDLTKLDAKGLRNAEKAELEVIEKGRVTQRSQIADEIKAHRGTANEEKLFLATKGAKTWEGVDDVLKKEMGVVGKRTLKADQQLDRLLDNPKALASRPQRALEALQQQESALEELLARRSKLEEVFRADTTPARMKAMDGAERALQRNRDLQSKLSELAATPTSQRLDSIVTARDALTSGAGAQEGFLKKTLGGAAFAGGAGLAYESGLPGAQYLAPLAGAAAMNLVAGKLGSKLSAASVEAARRTSKAIDVFMDIGKRAAPAAPVLASRVFSAYRYADERADAAKQQKIDRAKPAKHSRAVLVDGFRKRTDEIKRQTSYVNGVPKARPEFRQRVAASLGPIGVGNPILADRLETLAARRLEYLAKKIPRQPDLAAINAGPSRWQPSEMEMRSYARTMAAVEDPHGVIERLAHGTVSPEDAEALREVYPEMMADVTRQILERLPELQKNLPYERRLALSVFSGVPVDPAMDPRILAVLQASFTDEPGSEGGTQAPKPMPAFGSVKNQDATPSQIRQGA
jgi:hypothetical protein